MTKRTVAVVIAAANGIVLRFGGDVEELLATLDRLTNNYRVTFGSRLRAFGPTDELGERKARQLFECEIVGMRNSIEASGGGDTLERAFHCALAELDAKIVQHTNVVKY